ncbi:nucleotide disphospho-sugar-binding domain-containing protein [Mycolicibacterium sp. XJ1819]
MGRIVVAASPLAGHVVPMLRIGAHLRDVGHDVVFITAPEYRDDVDRAQLRLEPLGPAARIQTPPQSCLPMPGLLRRYLFGMAEIHATFVAPLTAQWQALRRVMAAGPVDAVLADVAFTGVLPLVLGEQPRPRVFAVGVGPLTITSSDAPHFGMAWQPRPHADYAVMNEVVRRFLMGHVHGRLDDALIGNATRGLPVSLVDWPRLADRMFQLTVPAFEYPRRDLPATVQFVGPVLPDLLDDFEPPSWWDAVVAAPKVVHVTQGTFDNRNLDQLIWPTLRALDGTDAVVVATTGLPPDERQFVDLPPNAFVTNWIPYSVLLPQVDVMITNGGYGGVQHALRHGIPLIVAGESSDKAEVAARVAYTGVGVDLRTAAPTSRRIRAAVAEVFGSSSYRGAAIRIGIDIVESDALAAIDGVVTAAATAPDH